MILFFRVSLFFVFIFQGVTSFAGVRELRTLYRSGKLRGMGGARITNATGEDAIFANPALMAENENVHFYPLISDTEGSADIINSASTALTAFSSFSADSINALLGKNIQGRAQVASALTIPNVGVSLLVDGQFAFYSNNPALPSTTLGYQTTSGVQLSWGMSFHGNTRRNRRNHEFLFGLGAKLLYRRGGYYDLDSIGLLELTTQQKNKLSPLVGNFESGYGGDLGLIHVWRPNKTFTLRSGTAWTDIGNTTFGGRAEPVLNNLGVGVSAKFDYGWWGMNFAWDFSHLLSTTDFRKKNHFGMSFDLPIISLMAGVNQTYLTYGFELDFLFFKVAMTSYGEELAETSFSDSDRRYLLRMVFDLSL